MLQVLVDEFAYCCEDVHAQVGPVGECRPQDLSDPFEGGAEVCGVGAEAGQQGPDLQLQRLVRLSLHRLTLSCTLYGCTKHTNMGHFTGSTTSNPLWMASASGLSG